MAELEVKAKAAQEKKEKDVRRQQVRQAGGSVVLARAAVANMDQRSVSELFASQKPSQKRKASDALPPSSEVPLPKRVSRVTKLGKAQEALGADQGLLSHLILTRKDL